MAEERRFRSASGVPITLRRRQHSASCRELAVLGPRLQLRSLSAATSAVWLAAYGLFALSENSMVLSAAIFITLIGLIIYLHFVKIDQESLLVIGSLGIQVTSSYASGKESTIFIEMGQVKDVVINEAIHMQKVIYYLCILLQDPEDPQGISEVVPLFQVADDSCLSLAALPGWVAFEVSQNDVLGMGFFIGSPFKRQGVVNSCKEAFDGLYTVILFGELKSYRIIGTVGLCNFQFLAGFNLVQSSKPRLDCLIEVYKSCQEILEQRKTAPQPNEIK